MDGLAQLAKVFTGGGKPASGIPGVPNIPGIPAGGTGGGGPLWQQVLLGSMFGTGELGNILEGVKQSKLQSQQADYNKYLTALVKDPAQISKMATAEAAPLSQALTQALNNNVQGDLAQRGLSQAPGIFAASETQAQAPYIQQNQNTALQAVLQQLGLPVSSMASAATNFRPPTDLSGLLGQFLKSFPNKTSVPQQAPTTPGITFPTNIPGINDSWGSTGDAWGLPS